METVHIPSTSQKIAVLEAELKHHHNYIEELQTDFLRLQMQLSDLEARTIGEGITEPAGIDTSVPHPQPTS